MLLRIFSLLFFICIGLKSIAAITSVVVTQASTAIVNQGATNQVLIRIEVNSSTAETISRFRFMPQGTLATDFPNINIYYTGTNPAFSATNLFGGTVANPGIGTGINRTGAQAIPVGTVYFWIAADISATAIGGNSIDMEFKNIRTVSGGATNYGAATNPAGTRIVASIPMTYFSSTTQQASTSNVQNCSASAEILKIRVDMTGDTSPLDLTTINLSTNGTTNLAEVSSVNVYYTGTSNSFSNTNLFGNAISGTNVIINGNQTLTSGANYFWVEYVLLLPTTIGNVLDGTCASVTVDGNIEIPIVSDPIGNRSIVICSPSPGGVNNNLTLWLDAKNGAESGGVNASNLDLVDRWVNKATNAGLPFLNQTINNKKPIFNDINLNYNPVLTFDGINDKLKKSVLGSAIFDADNNTIVMVHRYNNGVVYFKWEQNLSGNRIGFEKSGNNIRFDFPSDAAGDQNISTFNYDANGQIVSGTTVSGSSTLRNMGISDAPNNTSGSLNTSFTSQLSLGDNVSFSVASDMDYAEIIVFNRTLNAFDLNKVESYLAIKYGMTLGINGTSLNYNSSVGSVVWDVALNNGFNFDIGGVSRDDKSMQDQRKSTSNNKIGTNNRDILTISNGLDFTAPSMFVADTSFILWGHNDGTLTNSGSAVNYITDNSITIQTIFDRVWKSQETGTVSDVTLEFDMSNSTIQLGGGVTDYNNVRLLVDEDGDFSNGATAYSPVSYNTATNLVYFQHDFTPTNGNNLTQGNGFFFTLAYVEPFVAYFTMSDTSICVGETITFTDSSYTAPNSWNWTFNGGDITSANTQGSHTITFNTAGTYDILLTASNVNNSDDTTLQITVYAPPSIGAGLNDTICMGENYTLTAVNPDGASLVWNNGVVDGVQFTPVNTQEYIVIAQLNGCINSDTVELNINPNPTLIIPSDVTICAGEEAILNATSIDATSIIWNNGITNNQPFTPVNTTMYTATATITQGTNVCTTLDSVVVIVNANPIVNADAAGTTLVTLCHGESYTLTANNPSGGVLTWSNGVMDNVSFTPTDSLMYYVTSVLNGCIGSDSIVIDVVDSPIAQAGLDQIICIGDSVELIGTSDQPFATIIWGQGVVNNSYVYPTSTQTYIVTATLGNCISTDSITVTIVYPPNAGFSYNPNPVTIDDTEILFTQFDTNIGETYDWSFGDNAFSMLESPIHVYPEIAGSTYDVQLIVTDSYGCVDSSSIQITVSDVLVYYIPNAFTPDGNEFNETFLPIFTSGFDPHDYHMTIYNRWGEVIFESFDYEVGWDGTYKGRTAEDGVYIWTVEFGELISDKRILEKGSVTLFR